MEWDNGKYIISDDKNLINVQKVQELLSQTYWASDRSKDVIRQTINNSVCFGLYYNSRMIGFARAVTDEVVFSWISDLVIDEPFRGRGLGKWFVRCIVEHPDIVKTRMHLATRVNRLYERYDFEIFEAMRRYPRD